MGEAGNRPVRSPGQSMAMVRRDVKACCARRLTVDGAIVMMSGMNASTKDPHTRRARHSKAWVGDWLRRERDRSSLSIDDVARALGIHPSSVVRRENGKASISADDMPSVVVAYKTTLRRYAVAGEAAPS